MSTESMRSCGTGVAGLVRFDFTALDRCCHEVRVPNKGLVRSVVTRQPHSPVVRPLNYHHGASQKVMKDILIIGLVGLLWELLTFQKGELITVVLFSLLVVTAIPRTSRLRDVAVICGVGLLWETILADDRNAITIALFGLPLLRLLLDTLATARSTTPGASRRIAWSSISPSRIRVRVPDGFFGLARRVKSREFMFELVAIVGMLSLGIGVAVFLMHRMGVSREIIGYGALSYALGAVGFKGLLYAGFVVPVLHKRLSPAWLAAAQGFVSALSELGAAAVFFLLVTPRLSLPELIAFGAAAGIVEALVIPLMSIGGVDILGGTPLERHGAEQWQELGATPLAVMVAPIVERGLTMALHISSRALIYAAIVLGNFVPALLAVFLFASVDGVAYYALLNKWKLLSFSVAVKFYALVAAASGILSLVFWRLHASLW